MASILATSLDVWDLPTEAKVGVTVLAALLVGLLTWATAGSRAEKPAAGDGPSWRPPDQWPPVSAHFTGRTESLAELRRVFAGHQRSHSRDEDNSPLVVSVYGRGGVGKSMLIARFGHEIADRFPDGRLYADLRGAVEAPIQPEEVLIGFLRALGVRLTTDPGGPAELRKLWLTWTKGKRILIGLDNAQDGDQVKDLIPAEPGCAVMITSRQPLFLLNTYDKQLSVFSEAQGVELLARLAGDDRVAADLESAQEIVRMCDHLPLAISICGGRLATRENWALRELADRLRDERRRLDHLELARRLDKSVRASLQLSYDDCTGLQRRLLRLLSLLTAPDVPGWVAGELLAASELDGADQLEALIDTQLAECSGIDFSGVMRYRLHDLVRIFAHELAVSDEDDDHRRAAIERVLSGYRRRAETAAMARWPQDWGQRQERRPGDHDRRPGVGGRLAQRRAADHGRHDQPGPRPGDVGPGLGPGPRLLLALPLPAGLLVRLADGRRDRVRGGGPHGRPAGPGHRAAGPGGGERRAGQPRGRQGGRRARAGDLHRPGRVLVVRAGDAGGRHGPVQRRQPRPGPGLPP
ncbi:NB-ARC domain-containing protein [Streptosporangium canum]|uniref:NB-ARC domain-containing protein n=1 Tax=Streptosporangium canum TaxID=324952 RepID=UPI0033A44DE0